MSDSPVLGVPSGAKIRDELAELVRRDLVGPTDLAEEITGPPGGRQVALREKYPVGCLAPAGLLTNPAALDGLAEEGEASGDDDRGVEAVPAVPSFYPSSMGLSFAVSTRHIELLVEAKWGRYLRDHASTPLDDGSQPMVWRRQQRGGRERVTLVEGEIKPFPIDAEQPEVMVRGRVRRHDGQWIVSLFLVNTTDPTGKMMNATWIFQAELEVRGVEKGSTPFCPRELPLPDEHVADPTVRELRTLAMRYRHAPAFAVGHGVGVLVETLPDAPNRALSIRTEAMPWYEMPATDATRPSDEELLAGVELDMATLAEADRESLRHALEPIVVAYQKWILDRSEEVASDPSLDRFRVDAELALDECRRAADRIREGIQVLLDPEDPEPLAAFRFANRAMRLQRLHTMAAAARRADPNLSLEDAVAAAEAEQRPEWRLFQLAFLLMGLPALADPTHPNRRAESGLADLLWFPTGGGKTEAYLGLAAFAMGIRRRKQSFGGFYAEDGVAVLMRYTLRLLTVQQFQRAAALICACESLRREDPAQWGDTTFRLGLWVGGSVTPNRTEDAETAVKEARGQLKGRPGGGKGSPHQLTNCPWCGTMLMPDQNVEVDTVRGRTVVFCGDRTGRCPFTLRRSPGEGLPVLVVDEEIYRLLPAFVIATVDKFAQLPWRGSVQALFGKVTGWCSRHGYRTPETPGCDSLEHRPSGRHPAARVEPVGALRPPDLIVQDELHLISGPLGSLVGLYETVVDELATWCPDLPEAAPVRPMVIASTATVRGAEAQVNGVFTRKLAIFPPPGTDSRNSFFARTRPTDELPGRRYVGVCAHGRKFKSLLIRLYVAGMAAAQLLHERYGGQAATDAYMTMVGYFGSLRELGGMRRVVDDDVATRLYDGRQLGLARREKPDVAELTSRLHSSEIPEILRRLEVPVPIARDPKGTDVYPVDVLLATNMISVGVDISRLGLMVVAGQPKSAAEYIQATSRVGRAAPGLVFTAFNWARPRDLSHYETFEHFHGSAYRHVEALSVTPFADRALDRGLTAVLASLVRQHDATWNANRDAERVDRHAPEVSELVAAVVDRAAVVTGDPSVAKLVRARLDRSLDRWAERAATMYQQLGYRGVADGRTVGLLTEPDTGQWTEWTCPTSLRNVEPGIRLLIREGSEPLGKERENPYRRPTDQAPTLLDTASFEPDDESNEEKAE
ncbi:DISARM system helicase DrmA [Micromonospora tulbaghiae]|uniref:Helicase conserved C-terminal domain-containing protein n=1 Tax=Micromonospora tulbaghiae TaxID=479978 RepID=A0ABY0KNW4_9ACTN|nr:DISARM system helicase DrmA [Micromonospora tulbaghiae]MDX5457482.1 DISARM system helicase DrmA [Micromonospora tulbaghiae]SCE95039.1 Helicase conserved C-terminal domain-containing protein [Micromonospora tulbaghiae]